MIRFMWKFAVFLLVIGASQWAASHLPFLQYEPDNYAELKRALETGCDIVYIGDSTACQFDERDTDKRFTPAMLDALLPEQTIFNFSRPGTTPEIYSALAKSIVRQPDRPAAMVIVLNLRVFSPVWDMRPEYQRRRHIAILNFVDSPYYFLLRPYLIFGNFESPISQSEYEAITVFDGHEPVGTVWEFDNPSFATFSTENLRKRIVVQYLGDVNRDHRKIAALTECVRVLETHGIRAYVYATPVDWQTGVANVGDRFLSQIERNVGVVEDAVQEAGGAFLDCSFLLESDDFDWKVDLYPNEHLNQEGRLALAETLRDWIEADQQTLRDAS